MPRLKTNLYKPHRAWTRIPNTLLDSFLPKLKDTELRILLVLLRYTVGWNRPDASVVLSYRRLKDATGRESEAISKALRSLEAQGLIHIAGFRHHRKPKESASYFEGQQ